MTLVKLDLDRDGKVLPPRHDKLIVIDADTVAFASCIVCEYEVEDDKWDISLTEALSHSMDKLQRILDIVGGKPENVRLHFTGGRDSFRYQLLKDAFPEDPEMHYKFKRKKKRAPVGLRDLKKLLCNEFEGVIHYDWEADDQVVLDKKVLGDEAILVAVDKDVIMNTVGTHFNYYESAQYKIAMKWVTISEDEARYNQYMQMLTGDKSDNIPGIKGVGPAKAAKFLVEGMSEEELWQGVLFAHRSLCKREDISPEDMALLNARLVGMHQLTDKGIVLWSPKH